MVRKRLSVAIPASIIADTPHPREKTSKIGFVGRAAAIFRVDEIIVFADNPKINQNLEIDLIASLLSYMETPQYLRKHLFGLRPELQFAGILPPLRTPHHPLKDRIRDLKLGEYREGVAVSHEKDGMLIDIGVEKPAFTPGAQFAIGKRLTLKVTEIADQLETQIVDRDEIGDYWGYVVSVERRSLGKLFEEEEFDFVIATSKFATRFQDALRDLEPRWKRAENKLVLFGSPNMGLHEIAKDEGKNLNDLADFVLNTVPGQGTETVRTEEALLATLAVLNVHFKTSG